MSSPPEGLLLHTAAVTGNLEASRQLIEAGSDVNLCDSVGLTPLHLAAWRGYPEVCLVLLQNNADPLVVDKQVMVLKVLLAGSLELFDSAKLR
jgi:ankyrin repeat protein